MIVIGTISGGTVRTDYVTSLLALEHTVPFMLFFATGGYPHLNRTAIVDQALSQDASHVMFIDNDMVFPPNGITTLLSHKKEIVGANYSERRLPLVSTVKFADSNGILQDVDGDDIPKTLFPCYALGTGFMLIECSVFKKIPKPWFFYESYTHTDGVTTEMTEDVYFCKKAKEYGYTVYCDPTIHLGHIGSYQY